VTLLISLLLAVDNDDVDVDENRVAVVIRRAARFPGSKSNEWTRRQERAMIVTNAIVISATDIRILLLMPYFSNDYRRS